MAQKCQLNQEALAVALEFRLIEREATLVASVHNDLGLGKKGAHEHLGQALSLAQQVGERALFATALGNLALVARDVAKLESALDLMEKLGDNHKLKVYQKHYEDLLVNRWLHFNEQKAAASLLSVGERLHTYYQTHPGAAEMGVTANLHLLLNDPSCDEARAELKDYFTACASPSRAVLA